MTFFRKNILALCAVASIAALSGGALAQSSQDPIEQRYGQRDWQATGGQPATTEFVDVVDHGASLESLAPRPSREWFQHTNRAESAMREHTGISIVGPDSENTKPGVLTLYEYQENTVYRVYTRRHHITDIRLAPGEVLVSDVIAGDTSRWTVTVGKSGSGRNSLTHVYMKPSEDWIETNLIIPTNRHTYQLQINSVKDFHMPIIAWRYPVEEAAREAAALAAQEAEEERSKIDDEKFPLPSQLIGKANKARQSQIGLLDNVTFREYDNRNLDTHAKSDDSEADEQMFPEKDDIGLQYRKANFILIGHESGPVWYRVRDNDYEPIRIANEEMVADEDVRKPYIIKGDTIFDGETAHPISTQLIDPENIPERQSQEFVRTSAQADAGVDLEALDEKWHFSYRVRGARNEYWRPIAVFDDGVRTYLQFSHAMRYRESPVLFSAIDGKLSIVNYRVKGDYYIADRILDEAVLKLTKKKQLRIVRKKGNPGEYKRTNNVDL